MKGGNKVNRFTFRQTSSVFQATARRSGTSTVVTIPGEIAKAMEIEGKRVRVIIEDNEADTSPRNLSFMSEDDTKSLVVWADGTIIAYDEPSQDFDNMVLLDDPEHYAKIWKFIRELGYDRLIDEKEEAG